MSEATLRTEVLVVGAGVMGSSISLELARAGHEVVVVDTAGDVGHGSTSASSAIVRFNYSTWAGVALAWESLHAWRDWAGHLGDVPGDPDGGPADRPLARFRRTGMLVLPADAVTAGTTELFDRGGVPWERWTAREIARRLPGVDTGLFGPPAPVRSEEFFAPAHGDIDGIWTADAGYVDDPQLAAQNLAAAAERLGVRYLLHRRVTGIEAGPPWTVRTVEGEMVEAGVVVNAAGPWSGAVNELAGVATDFRVYTRPMRQEVHHVRAPADFDGDTAVTLADVDLGTYIRPTGDGHLLVGGTEPACDELEWVEDPDTVESHPTASRFEAQVTRAARRLPSLQVPAQPRGIVGVYDVTDDWAPI